MAKNNNEDSIYDSEGNFKEILVTSDINIFCQLVTKNIDRFIEDIINNAPSETFPEGTTRQLCWLLRRVSHFLHQEIIEDLFKKALIQKKYELVKCLISENIMPNKIFLNMAKHICDVLINYEIWLIRQYGDTKYPYNSNKIIGDEYIHRKNLSEIFKLFFFSDEVISWRPVIENAEIYDYIKIEKKYKILLTEKLISKTADSIEKFLVNIGNLPICIVPNILNYLVIEKTKSEIINPFIEEQDNYFKRLLLKVNPAHIHNKNYRHTFDPEWGIYILPDRAIYFSSIISDKSYINKLLEVDKTIYSKYNKLYKGQNILTYAVDNNIESLVDFIHDKITNIDIDIDDIDNSGRSVTDLPTNNKISEKLNKILAKKPINLDRQREKRKEFINPSNYIFSGESNDMLLFIFEKIGEAKSPEERSLFSKFLKKFIGSLSSDVSKILLKNGAVLDTSQNKNGINALHKVSSEEDSEKLKLILEIFSQQNINLNISDQYGNTALHIASKKGKLDNVKLLLEAGINKMITNNYGQTALDLAAGKKKEEIISILAENENIFDFVKPDPTPRFSFANFFRFLH